jgi:hydroxymethylbilane synthase
MQTITIATRGSRLALWQAEHIRSLLLARHRVDAELLVLKTRGDIIQDVPLSRVGGKGLFIKEIEEALLDGRADFAVHSMKDVPMELPDGLVLGAVPRREDPADLLLSVRWPDLASLPAGARVGTSSLRRQAQILSLRPDLAVSFLRGNVDTRMRKLREGQFDAIIMAAAGLKRLGLAAPFMHRLEAPSFLPAAGQGALGIEYSSARRDLRAMLQFLDHPESSACVAAERGFLAGLSGGCQAPIAAYAVLRGGAESGPGLSGAELHLEGLVGDARGERIIRRSGQGDPARAVDIGLDLARAVARAGGDALLREIL